MREVGRIFVSQLDSYHFERRLIPNQFDCAA